jgi:hypothetical protein
MQELREKAAAAEFHSSAARRQLEALADMVRWQGAGAGVGAGAGSHASGAQQPLPAPPGHHTGGAGSTPPGAGPAPAPGAVRSIACLGAPQVGPPGPQGAAAKACSESSAGPLWRASGIWGPVPVYETVSALSLRDSRWAPPALVVLTMRVPLLSDLPS